MTPPYRRYHIHRRSTAETLASIAGALLLIGGAVIILGGLTIW